MGNDNIDNIAGGTNGDRDEGLYGCDTLSNARKNGTLFNGSGFDISESDIITDIDLTTEKLILANGSELNIRSLQAIR